MKLSTDNLILCLIAAFSLAAAAVVATKSLTPSPPSERGFQQALGGLGLGCQIDLTRSSWQFDPRIADGSPALDTVPGLGQVSPWHAISLYPSPDGGRLAEE